MRKRAGEVRLDFIERCLSCEDKKMTTELCNDLWEQKQLSAVKRIRSSKKKDLMEFRKERVYVDSAWIDRLMYNDETFELVVRFNDGVTYTYDNVNLQDFNDIIDGVESPLTTGENQYGSWAEGVPPSVGATLYQRLIKKGNKGKQGGEFR
jgi:hypothetical protein